MIDKRNLLKPGVLSAEQEEQQKRLMFEAKMDDIRDYFSSHPELRILYDDFASAVLLQRPVDVRDFAAEYFSDPNLRSNTLSKLDKTGDSE